MVVTETIRAWARAFPQDEVVVAVPKHRWSLERVDLPQGVRLAPTRLRFHPLINNFELPALSRRLGPFDAVFCQNFATPFKTSVVFLHDVLFQTNPEWFTLRERTYFQLMVRSAKRAHVVLTSSRTERLRIELHNPQLRNVVDTGLGVSRVFTDGTDAQPITDLLSKSFILSVGRLNARKNLLRTIEGALKSGVLSTDFPLVIVGEASGKTEDLNGTFQAAIRDGRIRFLGFVSDEQLLWLYANASLMTFLSLDEGYGLPPVEAMLLGTRVLASDIPVMREVLGDYPGYVDPTSTTAISRAIKSACIDNSPTGLAKDSPTWERMVETSRRALLSAANSEDN